MAVKKGKNKDRVFCILTVGTGTAGSDLHSGLETTLRLLAPDGFWLVPSTDPTSRAIAQLLAEADGLSGAFLPWADGVPFREFEAVDDVFACRTVLREVIRKARDGMGPTDRLVVNPTSGTKQMSSGAVLAALFEEVGELHFTTGKRRDGIVQCGTEELAIFPTERFFADRALADAQNLARGGAYRAAAAILTPYVETSENCEEAQNAALCLHAWHRQRYSEARQLAAGCVLEGIGPVRRALEALAVADGEMDVLLVADLLASAAECLRFGYPEDALARVYRATELAAKQRLAGGYGVAPPYSYPQLNEVSSRLAGAVPDRRRGEEVRLGLHATMEYLETFDDPLARDFFDFLRAGLVRRNETFVGHGVASVSEEEVTDLHGKLCVSLERHLEGFGVALQTVARPEDLLGGSNG